MKASDARKNKLYGRYQGGRWELIDVADRDNPKETLLRETRIAFGSGWDFCWRAR